MLMTENSLAAWSTGKPRNIRERDGNSEVNAICSAKFTVYVMRLFQLAVCISGQIPA